jgi:ADP-ribose pyrophosphatase YjhB (NUDIX family)
VSGERAFRIGVFALIHDGERVLLARRRDSGWWNLPGGGMERGETVDEALRREVAEETGLEVAVRRLLAFIAYHAEDDEDAPPRMFTFAFLLDELGGTLGAADPAERLAGYREIDIPDLLSIADQLEHLPDSYSVDFGESWRDWGSFRAIVHRVVWRALSDPENRT